MKTTVDLFILGAGASKSYGFPTGAELRQIAIDELVAGTSTPLMSEVIKLGGHFKYSAEDVTYFKTSLESSTRNKSIDAFIESQAKNDRIDVLSAIAKVVTAILIMRCEDDDKLRPGDDWYKELFDKLYEGNKTFPRFLENKIQFITFNYDRSLERYLQVEAAKEFDVDEDEAAKQLSENFTVIHPHGSLGKLWVPPSDKEYRPYQQNYDSREVIAAAEAVRLITDEINVDEEPDFLEARRLILEAPRVHFIGFGYNTDNMRRLGFFGTEVEDFRDDKVFGSIAGVSEQKVNRYVREFKLNRTVGRHHDLYSLVRFPGRTDNAVEYMNIACFD